MNRRDLLIATSGSALAGSPLASLAVTSPIARGHDASCVALLPLRPALGHEPSVRIEAVQIGRCYPDPGASEAGSLSVDLVVAHGRTPIVIRAWQQTRRHGGQVSAASRAFLPFVDGREVDLRVSVRTGEAGAKGAFEATWETTLWSGGLHLLATRRRSTGLPPLPADLHWDEVSGLVVPDAAGHDFDAVLLTTV